MNKFIQVFDKDYVKVLEKQGLKVIDTSDKFTLMTLNDKFNFSELDMSKIAITKKMTF